MLFTVRVFRCSVYIELSVLFIVRRLVVQIGSHYSRTGWMVDLEENGGIVKYALKAAALVYNCAHFSFLFFFPGTPLYLKLM